MRIKARRKTTRKPARPARRKAAASRQPRQAVQKPLPSAIRSPGVLVAIVALSGAVIIAAMGRVRGPETSTADVPLPPGAELTAAPNAAGIDSAAINPALPPPAEARTRTAIADAPAAASPPPAEPPPAVHSPASAPRDEPPALDAAVLVTPAATIEPPIATIVGCLTFDDGEYRLKDATGTDAPKSRSWKSGFLTKRSARIDVVDSNQSLGLAGHVGQRVEIAGTLLEREMQARSLRQLAASCKK